MYDLTSIESIRYLSNKYGFNFKKGLGQNFLTDKGVLSKILQEQTTPGVLEIGPGFGTLTAALATKAQKVVSIEIDKNLEKVLAETLAGFSNIKIVFGDILKIDLKKLLAEEFNGDIIDVAANLPYYITTPVIMSLLEMRLNIRKIILMIQKEVAQRITSKPGTKDYGALSVACQYYSNPKIVTYVSPDKFIPRPKVDSVVISLEILKEPKVIVKDEKLFFKIVKASFAQRRKTLANALSNSGVLNMPKSEIIETLKSLGFDENVRGETLSIVQFSQLSDAFTK